MTRKHYVLLAATIAANYRLADEAGRLVLRQLIVDLSAALKAENPRFDSDRFRTAATAL